MMDDIYEGIWCWRLELKSIPVITMYEVGSIYMKGSLTVGRTFSVCDELEIYE